MKSIKNLSFLLLLALSFISRGQTVTPLPEFKNEVVVVKTLETFGISNGELTISDGSDVQYSMELPSVQARNLDVNSYLLARVFNELKKQKYKLVGTNSIVEARLYHSNYIFQRE